MKVSLKFVDEDVEDGQNCAWLGLAAKFMHFFWPYLMRIGWLEASLARRCLDYRYLK